MDALHYIGFDVHKKTVSFCVKQADGTIVQEGTVVAQRQPLRQWAAMQTTPWHGAMEATLFSGWIYDTLKPYAQQLQIGHPALMKAIGASKKKSDRLDARKIADLVRCNLLPACYVAPPQIRELRGVWRYRNLVVREATRMQNKTAGLLMEAGVPYDARKLDGKQYFQHLLDHLEETPACLPQLLKLSRGARDMFRTVEAQLRQRLRRDTVLRARIKLLQSIDGVGDATALTWALEIGDPHRFPSIGDAQSYCGLTAAFRSSAGKQQRGPLSKQRNPHLQTMLIEAAKLAPRWNPQLAAVRARELERGSDANQATLQVARKLVAYLLAVDKSGQRFVPRTSAEPEPALSSPAGIGGFPAPPPVVAPGIAERSSPSRVRYAAPAAGAPWTAPGRSAAAVIATGGSGGNPRPPRKVKT